MKKHNLLTDCMELILSLAPILQKASYMIHPVPQLEAHLVVTTRFVRPQSSAANTFVFGSHLSI
jgi:hypothetical protein